MKKLNEQKAIKLRMMLNNDNIEDINVGEKYYYLGPVYTSVDISYELKKHKLIIKRSLDCINDSYNVFELIKMSNEEAKEIKTGKIFKLKCDDKIIDCHNPNLLLNGEFDDSLYLTPRAFFKDNNMAARFIYLLYGEKNKNRLKPRFKAFSNLASFGFEYINRKAVYFLFSSHERTFYETYGKSLSFYSEEPKIGEYFGCVGNVSSIVPRVNETDGSKYFCTRDMKTEYPLLFKRISVTDAIEVTSGVVFHFKSLLSTNVSFDNEYKNSPLCIDPVCYIKPTEEYKEIYGKSISNFDLFSKWISESLSEAKEIYAREMDECENFYRSSLEDAFDIARVDNAIYDLEKNNVVKESDVHKLIKEIASRTTDFD